MSTPLPQIAAVRGPFFLAKKANGRGVPAGRGQREGGFTLIEMGVALAIIVVLMGAVIMSVNSITGAKAKQAAGELAGTIRSLYDTAALTGRTCRLVFQLPAGSDERGTVQYRAECAAKGVTTSLDRDSELKQDNREAEELARRGPTALAAEQKTLSETLSGEERRIEGEAKFSAFTSEEIKPQKFPSSVRVGVWTKHQREEVSSGSAYLYFFPQGFTERAMVFVRQGKNVWTITVSPLTGKTAVVGEELEVPRS